FVIADGNILGLHLRVSGLLSPVSFRGGGVGAAFIREHPVLRRLAGEDLHHLTAVRFRHLDLAISPFRLPLEEHGAVHSRDGAARARPPVLAQDQARAQRAANQFGARGLCPQAVPVVLESPQRTEPAELLGPPVSLRRTATSASRARGGGPPAPR